MPDHNFELNCWLFQGSAVHYYLQEHPSEGGFDGLMTEALHKSGYHSLDIDYEVSTTHRIEDDLVITGTCDILCHGEDGRRSIFDIKYSSVHPSTHKGRLFKYLSQVNTYSHMFGADEHGLILVNNRAGKGNSPPHSIPEGITVIDGEPQEDNWEMMKDKARAIHNVLKEYGYEGGERWSTAMLEDADVDFWEELFNYLSVDNCPSYDKECKYCGHKDYCPIQSGDVGGGLNSFKGGV